MLKISIANKRFTYLNYRNDFYAESNGNVSNFYVTIPCGTGLFIGPTETPMPTEITCAVHRARSNGTGNCGALTNVNKCMMPPFTPLTNCK